MCLFCSRWQNDCGGRHEFKNCGQSLRKSSVSCVVIASFSSLNGELDQLMKRSCGVVSVVVAIVIRPTNGKVLSP